MSKPVQLAIGSIVIGVLVLALKYWAAALTGSVALYSDALESIVNVVTAVAALVAVSLAQRPADAALPYGYHKAEYFSAVVEGVFILVAALMIFSEAWRAFESPAMLTAPVEGLSINAVASIINAIWCFILIRAGRRFSSPALEADGQHLLTDVVSSAGVIVGLIVAIVTGLEALDALIAVIVGLNILWSGTRLIARSVGGLMDIAVPKETLETLRELISANAEGAIEAHDLRTRRAGRMTFIDFHLVVPGTMSVEAAHAICDRIEAALKDVAPQSLITIHVEPEDKAKHTGVLVL
ncbi:cation diffusion facilitator family transporter [Pelagibacterium xiamenense]|uniref:cation diffusion facilitator family transporter n=1 Tax=Pelagibacterium xiamenense TaxID=2901140 RepID=UPI001E4302AE|nr:cation diffusion facilitator family transporter [Pelagibacterium xiamenense]MCD7058599.1 cation diffusion facilitator family transporter [Pelagibacterium xiamenense]